MHCHHCAVTSLLKIQLGHVVVAASIVHISSGSVGCVGVMTVKLVCYIECQSEWDCYSVKLLCLVGRNSNVVEVCIKMWWILW